jgi:hypothetical protein
MTLSVAERKAREAAERLAILTFDECWLRYQRWKELFIAAGESIHTVDPRELSGDGNWRPSSEYMGTWLTDFEQLGRKVLGAVPTWEGRRRVWETFFVGGVEYRQAIRAVGVPAGTFDYWFAEIKRQVGREFVRVELLRHERATTKCAPAEGAARVAG